MRAIAQNRRMLWQCSLLVVLLAVAWFFLSQYSEQIVEYFEVRGSGEARRQAFPPGKHEHPTPVMGPPEQDVLQLSWDSFLHSLPNGKKIWWQKIWPKDRAPKAVVAFIHGFADHADFSLYNAARAFAEHTGCVALLVDMPGHGRSDGLHGLVPDWPAHLNALDHWCSSVCIAEQRKYGGSKLPLFLFGSSMGGAVAIGLALRQPNRFAGIMLIAPMVKLAAQMRPSPALETVLKVLSRVPILADIPLHKGKDLAALNYAEDALWRLDEDKRMNALHYWKPTRLRTAASILTATDSITKQMEALRTPMLVLHGTNDRTTAPELSEELVKKARATDKTFKMVEGAAHGLHYGESPARMKEVYRTMFDWLRSRM